MLNPRNPSSISNQQPSLGKETFKMSGKSNGWLAIASATGSLVQNGSPDKSREGKFTLISEPIPNDVLFRIKSLLG